MLHPSIKSPVYKYRFSRPSRTYPSLGALHALDNYYVFGTLGKKTVPPAIKSFQQPSENTGPRLPGLAIQALKICPQLHSTTLKNRSFIDFGETISIQHKWREDFLDALDELQQQAYKADR